MELKVEPRIRLGQKDLAAAYYSLQAALEKCSESSETIEHLTVCCRELGITLDICQKYIHAHGMDS